MKNSSTVTIDVNGIGLGVVSVDGVEVKGVRSITTHVEAGEPPVVTLNLSARDSAQVAYEGASISVDGVELPVSVEVALWKHLAAKYGREIDVTTLDSTSREWASRDG
jgi:hypothetical protein